MYKKKILTIFIVLIILLTSVGQVYAKTVTSLKNEQKNVNKKIENIKDEVKALETKTKDVSEDIKDLDIKIVLAADELEEVEKQLKKLSIELEETIEELKIAEDNLNEQDDMFKKRLRVMYMNGNVGYLEVLLSSEDISDFLNRKDLIQKIAEKDRELLIFMKEQRDVVENKKVELEAKRASIETTKNELENKKKKLEETTRQKENMMIRLKQDIKAFEVEYDKLNELAKKIEKDIVALQSKNTIYSGGTMAWPAPGYTRVTSQFGYRIHPIFKVKKLHTGMDIGTPTGTKIVAANDGKVIHADWLGGYGKTIMIDHGGGIVTLYAHNSTLLASKGQNVKRGDAIAKAGSTGNSTGPHLHFEVRKNGAYQNPLPWVTKK